MNSNPAWIIFYGTLTTCVRAPDEDAAYEVFLVATDPVARWRERQPWYGAPDPPKFGRVMPPTRDEVTIRQPRESDRGWIEDSGDKAFLALLPELVDA